MTTNQDPFESFLKNDMKMTSSHLDKNRDQLLKTITPGGVSMYALFLRKFEKGEWSQSFECIGIQFDYESIVEEKREEAIKTKKAGIPVMVSDKKKTELEKKEKIWIRLLRQNKDQD